MNSDSPTSKILISVISSLLTLTIVAVFSFAGRGALIRAFGGITRDDLQSGITVYISQPGTDDIMSYNSPDPAPNGTKPPAPVFILHKGEKGATYQKWVLKLTDS